MSQELLMGMMMCRSGSGGWVSNKFHTDYLDRPYKVNQNLPSRNQVMS